MGVQVKLELLRARMHELGWRVESLAHHADVAHTTARNALQGKSVSLELAVRLSKALSLPLEDISPEANRLLSAVGGTRSHSRA